MEYDFKEMLEIIKRGTGNENDLQNEEEKTTSEDLYFEFRVKIEVIFKPSLWNARGTSFSNTTGRGTTYFVT